MTLRARLVLGLLGLAATALAITGVVTYREQRSFLLDRVDDQIRSALENPAQISPALGGGGSATGSGRFVPFGTYAELRYPDGSVVRLAVPGTSGGAIAALPAELAAGRIITVGDPDRRVGAGPVVVGPTTLRRSGLLVVAIPLDDVNETLRRLLVVELIVAAAVMGALAIAGGLIVKLGLRPLRQMEATAGAIAAGDLSRRVETADARTEVGRLGLALNEMLAQIERAFAERRASEDRLRRFVADASHELRTPLTSIRGYAELFRMGAASDPDDLAKTMRRIEQEANRMGVMVDDLLLLARLDQGRDIARAPVDLTRLATDAADDARAVDPGRPVAWAPVGPVVVTGDEVRLRQVFGNLMQNALRHTPPGTPVHLRVAATGSDAVIEVRDEGPGMDAETAAHVFERFYRADPSRARANGGTGLGLAIVAAIAEAHGGRVEVETAPGAGATFRVHVPVAPTPDAPPDEPALA
ncbi:MAG: sensor histidine kinase [Actinomycetota bacterium]